MANTRTITAANAILMLSVDNVYPTPQLMQGYAADASFETEASEVSEVVMGVDGNMSAGFTPFITPMTINLMPDSLSSDFFETWIQAQQTTDQIYFANGTVQIPATTRNYVLTKGVLRRVPIIPSVRKVLAARAFVIDWQNISPGPI